jgi:dTDP-4-amino-4,6-dideoxygalactose transaminase
MRSREHRLRRRRRRACVRLPCHGQRIGSFGDVGCFSFGIRTSTGEGGMIVLDRSSWRASATRSARRKGLREALRG